MHDVRARVLFAHREGDVSESVPSLHEGHAIRGGCGAVHPLPARSVRRQGGHARVHHVPAGDVQSKRG